MRLTTFFVILFCVFFLVGCPDSSPKSAFKGKKVYWHSENGAATNIDPIESATFYANDIVTTVYDTLFEYKYLKRGPYELKTNLAASMPQVSEDGLTYTIKIKEGVKFINDSCFKEGKGREVVAEDFVYSIKRHFDPQNISQGSWLWEGRIAGLDDWKDEQKALQDAAKKENKPIPATDYAKEIEGLKAVDKYTIQLKLVQPYPQILYTFAMGFAALVPREAVDHYKERLNTYAVGSGAYKLIRFDSTKAIMVKNTEFRKEVFDIYEEGYDDEKHSFTGIKELHGKTIPFVDVVIYSFMEQPISRWTSFTKGDEIQFTGIPTDLIDEVIEKKNPCVVKEKYKKYHFHEQREFGFVMNVFNMTDPNIGYNDDPKRNEMNKALRKAIRKAFNWEQRVERFYFGIGEAFVGIIPPGTSGYSEFDKESITHDVEGAKKLLADAGWTTDSLPVIEYPSSASVLSKQFFEQFRGWLLEIGYPKDKIKYKEYASFGDLNKAMKERKNMMNPYAWSLDYPDAENVMQLFYGPNASPGSNSSNFDNKEYNELFEKAKPMPDCEERTLMYKRMSEILLDECVGIFGFARTGLYMWHKDVIGFPTREILHGYFKYIDVKEAVK